MLNDPAPAHASGAVATTCPTGATRRREGPRRAGSLEKPLHKAGDFGYHPGAWGVSEAVITSLFHSEGHGFKSRTPYFKTPVLGSGSFAWLSHLDGLAALRADECSYRVEVARLRLAPPRPAPFPSRGNTGRQPIQRLLRSVRENPICGSYTSHEIRLLCVIPGHVGIYPGCIPQRNQAVRQDSRF